MNGEIELTYPDLEEIRRGLLNREGILRELLGREGKQFPEVLEMAGREIDRASMLASKLLAIMNRMMPDQALVGRIELSSLARALIQEKDQEVEG